MVSVLFLLILLFMITISFFKSRGEVETSGVINGYSEISLGPERDSQGYSYTYKTLGSDSIYKGFSYSFFYIFKSYSKGDKVIIKYNQDNKSISRIDDFVTSYLGHLIVFCASVFSFIKHFIKRNSDKFTKYEIDN